MRDEALDARTERPIWDALMTGDAFTFLAVSHRRFVRERADQLVVMSNGIVVYQGDPETGLATCGELLGI